MSQSGNWHVFTRGPLFEAVQSLGLFRDSKTFPDMIPNGFLLADKDKLAEVLAEFVGICRDEFCGPVGGFLAAVGELDPKAEAPLRVERLKELKGLGIGVIEFRSKLTTFIRKHFRGRPETAVAKGLPREPTCSMEAYIDSVWAVLRRDSRNLPQEMFNGTLIPLGYPYVVAGGRFDEVYYWDGYFTGEGLVLSGGLDLFHCMVKNYAAFIHDYGFMPNGNRRYYLTRSQPPFLYYMVDLIEQMKGPDFVRKGRFAPHPRADARTESTEIGYIDTVQKEYEFWNGKPSVAAFQENGENPRQVRVLWAGDQVVLNRYWDHFYDGDLNPPVQPRPEAYHEDVECYADSADEVPAATFFRHIRAAAESGWDFSSRWFRPNAVGWDGGIQRSITTIRTTDIVPVDLNALLYGMEVKLANWTGDAKYRVLADSRRKAFDLFWNKDLGWFFDYCTAEGQEGLTDVWSLAGAYPLFTKLLDEQADREKIEHSVRAIRTKFLRAGGVVTTLFETGHQWDYPNGWAPLQWIVVRGLLNYAHLDRSYRNLAVEIARRFVGCVGRTYLREGRIMEKYNVCEPEATAGGGEYVVQHGFGWTNGVVKKFMVEFRSELEADKELKRYLG